MTQPGRIPFREKIAYGFGDMASCLYWQTFMVYLMFFYTDVFGISASSVGLMLLIARIWDGINDPLIGALADRTKTRWGKFRPYLVWMSLPLAVLGFLTFTTPDLGPTGRLVWAFCTYNLLMMAYTAINIPYTALLGVISPSSVDRTTISSIKFIFAFGGGTLISYFLMPLVQTLGKTQQWTDSNAGKIADWVAQNPATHTAANHPRMIAALQHGWSTAFAIVGVIVVILFAITFLGTRERVRPPEGQKNNLKRDIGDLLRNSPWFILVAVTFTYVLYTAIRSTSSAHYFKYFVEYRDGLGTVVYPLIGSRTYDFEHLVSLFNTVGQLASIAGLLLLPLLVSLLGKKATFALLMGVGLLSTGAFYFLGPTDLFAMLALQAVAWMGSGPLAALLWAMYADTADYSDWKNGRRATGLVFSASTMTQKCGWALAAFFVGLMLDLFGYVANQAQNAEVVANLRLMMSVIPVIFGLSAILILLFFPLGEKRMKQIDDALRTRNQTEGTAS